MKKNNSIAKTIIFAGDFEKVTENGVTKDLIYLTGGAIYVKQAGQSDKIYYTHTNHLGSIMSITDNAGSEVFKASYDAWGKQTVTNSTFKFHRGFTGHEHLTEFGLINMNGRMYDPIIGRFLSPDPYVQNPLFSQSYNRYSYAGNNPLIYTDPTGYKWWHWVLGGALLGIIPPGVVESAASFFVATTSANMSFSFLSGFVSGLEKEAKGGVGDDGYSKWRITKQSWDDGAQRARNSWRLSMGLFKADEAGTTSFNQSFNQFWQVLSRHTWQQPFTGLGYELSNIYNNFTQVNGVRDFHGATVVVSDRMPTALSLGGYIVINPSYGDIDYKNTTLLHEYGHFRQLRQWGGPGFLQSALFSLVYPADGHKNIWVEQDANARALSYFSNRLEPDQIKTFRDAYPGYYDDFRFFRNWFYPWWWPLIGDLFDPY